MILMMVDSMVVDSMVVALISEDISSVDLKPYTRTKALFSF